MNANTIHRAAQRLMRIPNASISLIGADGYPTASIATCMRHDGLHTLYFASGLASNKARHIQANPRGCACFAGGEESLTFIGDFSIETDETIRRAIWDERLAPHFTGIDDPNYCILVLHVRRANLYFFDAYEEIAVQVPDAAYDGPAQSRCGLLCQTCSYREPCHCGGCIETLGHPFHGECPIAMCCQDRGYAHCGQCPDMPCDPLRMYSYEDPEHGDDPPGLRIEALRAWAAQEREGQQSFP